jgi:hypothetical protein
MGAFAGMTELLWTSRSASSGTARALVKKGNNTQHLIAQYIQLAFPSDTGTSSEIEPPIHKDPH